MGRGDREILSEMAHHLSVVREGREDVDEAESWSLVVVDPVEGPGGPAIGPPGSPGLVRTWS